MEIFGTLERYESDSDNSMDWNGFFLYTPDVVIFVVGCLNITGNMKAIITATVSQVLK